MSQPFSRYLHPFERPGHPSPEPEVRRAILAAGDPGPRTGRTRPMDFAPRP